MASLTYENYVKTIYKIVAASGGAAAPTGQIAEALGVSPGSVTSMLKTLADSELVSYTPCEGVRLTDAGAQLALRVLRRHRLIELFLATTLKMPWDEVHDEAEHLEHALSDRLVDRIDEYLGFPEADPHGDPIPKADGTVELVSERRLSDCLAGDQVRLVRVLDQSPDFLRYLTQTGLTIGAEGCIVSNQPEAGILNVRIGEQLLPLASTSAAKLVVEEANEVR